jgi:hypothetical protein
MSFKSFISSKNPGKGLYIFVWFVVWVPTNVVVGLLDTFFSNSILTSIDKWNTYILIAFPIEGLVYIYLGAFIYKKFSNIKISKVMPFIWLFLAINLLKLYSEISTAFETINKSIGFTAIAIIILYFGTCLGFRHQFLKSKQW